MPGWGCPGLFQTKKQSASAPAQREDGLGNRLLMLYFPLTQKNRTAAKAHKYIYR